MWPGYVNPKTKTPRRWSGRTFLQRVAYQNRTWFVKRKMREILLAHRDVRLYYHVICPVLVSSPSADAAAVERGNPAGGAGFPLSGNVDSALPWGAPSCA